MSREIFKNLPDTSTPINATKLNGVFNGEESMGSIVVEDVVCKNIYDSYSYPLMVNNAINGDTGDIYSSTTNWYATKEYIPVNKYVGKNIISSSDSTTICFYDSSKAFISKISKQGIIPTNAYYMRFDTHKDYVNELYIELGAVLTGYAAHKKFGYDSTNSMGNIVVDGITCKNMFNKNTAIDGYALLSATGELNKVDGWCASEYIPVKAGEKITISGKDSAGSGNCFYDVNKNYIETITAISGTITVPNNAYYLRINLKLDDKDTCQVEPGSVATNYVEHKEFSNKQIYSTSEQVIGTWIDGKPLYRKVVDCGALPNNTTKTVPSGISNVADMVKISGFSKDASGGYLPMPFVSTASPVAVSYNASNNQISITTSQDRTNYIRTSIILEYTKTTDATSTA